MDEKKKYQVIVGTVLDYQMDGFDYTVVFDEFTQAKEFALDAFQGVIDRLSALCEQIREAESSENFDLGWWEPLFEEIEGDNQSSEPMGEDVSPLPKESESPLAELDNLQWVHVEAFKICPQYDVLPSSLQGRAVKIAFMIPGETWGENMWVRVTKEEGNRLVGILENDPVFVDLTNGDEVEFGRDEILDYCE